MKRWLSVLLVLSAVLCACNGGATEVRMRADAGPRTFDPAEPIGPAMLPDGTCEQLEVGTTPGEVPAVTVVLDKSQSMVRDGLWEPAVRAVENLTGSLDQQVAFGLASFPDYTRPRGERASLQEACAVGSLKIAPELGAAGAIQRELSIANVDGNTPTAETLRQVARAIDGPDLPTQIIVLVTDGAPNCGASPAAGCECSNPAAAGNCPPELCLDYGAVDAVREVAESGTPVYVVGFRTSQWGNILDQMAAAGGTGRDTHIVASDGNELQRILSEIAGSVLPCTYELEAPPANLGYVQVSLDGAPLEHQTVSPDFGWRLQGDRTIELLGGACERVRDVSVAREVKITVECEPVDYNLI